MEMDFCVVFCADGVEFDTYWQNGGETDGVGFYYLETDGTEYYTEVHLHCF
jgi:hypothetical protein